MGINKKYIYFYKHDTMQEEGKKKKGKNNPLSLTFSYKKAMF